MDNEIIPEDVRQFILQNIESISQWEGLLLIRAEPDVAWSDKAVARSLYIGQQEAETLLAQLSERGLIVCEERPEGLVFCYRPRQPEIEPLMARAAELYKRYLVPMTHLIHSKPKSRIQQFADAFKIRKE